MTTTLRSIETFLRVVREGSFSAAGRQIGLSAAAVVRQLNALEDSLGVRLLNRSSRKLSLTAAGEQYHARIGPIMAALHEAGESASHFDDGVQGVLRVHCRLTVGMLMITPALSRFTDRYPDIRVELMMSNNDRTDIVGENFDIDVQVGERPDSSLRVRKLAPDGSAMCASPRYLETYGRPSSPEELSRHNCLAYQFRSTWRLARKGAAKQDIKVSGNVETNNGVTVHALMRQGIGIGLLPLWAVADDIAAGRLVRLFPDWRITHSETGNAAFALYPDSRTGSAKVRAFLDFLVETFSGQRGDHHPA